MDYNQFMERHIKMICELRMDGEHVRIQKVYEEEKDLAEQFFANELDRLRTENERFKEGLESIIKHEEMIAGPTMMKFSSIRTIALKALGK